MQQRIRNYHSQAGVKATAKGRKYTDKICLTLGSAIIFNLVENRRQQFSVTIISTSFQLTSCLKISFKNFLFDAFQKKNQVFNIFSKLEQTQFLSIVKIYFEDLYLFVETGF